MPSHCNLTWRDNRLRETISEIIDFRQNSPCVNDPSLGLVYYCFITIIKLNIYKYELLLNI